MLFYSCTIAIVVTLGIAMAFAYVRSRDSFHPMLVLGPMALFLYAWMPMKLDGADELHRYFSAAELDFVQVINAIGVLALCVGIIWGSWGGRRNETQSKPLTCSPTFRRRALLAAIIMGGLGLLGFLYTVASAGGFSVAYGKSYGGGWDDNGYIRESILLPLPASILLQLLGPRAKLWSRWTLVRIAVASPLIVHGLLGARRGPTFMILAGVGVAWYFARQRRPKLVTAIAVGLGLATLLLALVSNRKNIKLGGEIDLTESPTEYLSAGVGNEFIFGSGCVIDALRADRFYWGARYAVIFLVRPIPRALWPTKYEDAAKYLGAPDMDRTLGAGDTLVQTMGWRGAEGAAQGLVADMWMEFYWLYPLALALIGWFYGFRWKASLSGQVRHVTLYCLLLALSVYAIVQTLEAVAFRFLLLGGPTLLALAWAGLRPNRVALQSGFGGTVPGP